MPPQRLADPGFAVPFPRFVLPSVSPSRSALPKPSGALPCHCLASQSFAPASPFLALLILCPHMYTDLHFSEAGQCLADPWPRAPRRANPLQCTSVLFLRDAMLSCSIASRIEAVQIRLPSPPGESPRPNAEANQIHAFPSRPGGAPHRSSRISYVNRPLPLFRHWPNPRSRP